MLVTYNFALKNKSFYVNYDTFITPSTLLGQYSGCKSNAIPGTCFLNIGMFLILPIIFETAIIILLIKLRKESRKLVLLLFFALLQVLISTVIILYLFVPDVVEGQLYKQAYKNVMQTLSILDDEERLNGVLDAPADCISCIVHKMEDSKTAPQIIDRNPMEEAVMKIIGINLDGKDSFYKSVEIPFVLFDEGRNMDLDTSLSQKKFGLALFPNATLIVGYTSKDIIQELTPIISKKLITQQLSAYSDSDGDPSFVVLNQDDYISYQKAEEEKYKNELIKNIKQIDDYITQLNDLINYNQNIIDSYDTYVKRNKEMYKEYVEEPQNTYDKYCKDAEYPQCETLKKQIKENKKLIEDDKNHIEEGVKNAREYNQEANLSKLIYQNALHSGQSLYEKAQKEPITAEYQRGISYVADNKVYINYYGPDSGVNFNDYLFTTLHEYLHQFSYTAGEGTIPVCLEEGITDQTASTLLNNVIPNSSSYITYAMESEIAKTILDKVSYGELMNVYFSKSEDNLKSVLKKYYKNVPYGEFVNECNNLYYTDLDDVNSKIKRYNEVVNLLSGNN